MHGRLVRVTNPNNAATTYAYDAANNRTSRVTAANAAGTPNAINDSSVYAYPANAPPFFVANALSFSAPLANDTDPNGDPLSIASVTNGAYGTTFTDSEFVLYTSSTTTNGTDSFTYTASNGHNTDSATVNIIRRPQDASPYAFDDVVHAYPINIPGLFVANAFAVISPLDNGDYDYNGYPLTITSVTPGPNGMVSIGTGNTVVYISDASAGLTDTFQYTISNGHGGTKTANVTVYRHP